MLTTREIRTLAILREIPFVFSFTERVKMWQHWIQLDKIQHQREANFLVGPFIEVKIRRNYIYEDAFEQLSLENSKTNCTIFAICFLLRFKLIRELFGNFELY